MADRFWSKVNKDGPLPSAEAVATHPDIAGVCCWIFGSSENLTRYRAMRSGNDYVRAHHVAWFLATGKWPEPNCLHKCDVRACVRFEHLFEGTQKDNIHDMIAKRRDRIVGARHGNAKLTDEQVAEIRSLGAPWVRSTAAEGRSIAV